ncbi:MAG: enoyl-CoA hydratase [Pseudomonadaceae bacterium]|nr:enoyl-CoA hydratase [Pseudomonadaceae bacterium]
MSRTVELATNRILARIDDHATGWLTFNQPERHNALSLDMWQGMGDAFAAFEDDDDVRVIVMRGAGGKAFVSGADISEFDSKRSNAQQKQEYGAIAGRATKALATCSKPVIALIEGYCIGGGLATALGADIRIATNKSTFGIPAGRLGLGYEYASVAKLSHVVGPSNARHILLSAELFGAEQALDYGLIHQMVDHDNIDEIVTNYSRNVAANAPLTLRAVKASLAAFERGGRPDEIAAAEALVADCFDSEDYKEGRRAFRDKRTPDFTGR